MEIDMRAYYKMIRKRLWVVVLGAVLFTLPTALLTSNTYDPIYQASTDLIVNDSANPQQQTNYSILNIIIKSPAIIDKVIEWYPDLHLTAEQLSAAISVSDVSGSQVMRITARYYPYEMAVKIANDVTQVFQSEIPKLMKVESITVLNPAKKVENPQPINPKSNKYIQMIFLSFLASLVVSVGFIFLLDSLDNTLKTEEDIRSIFGKPTLAVVPKMRERESRTAKQIKARTKRGEASYVASNH
jgi:capsular polysaccharide biosynthesis protein